MASPLLTALTRTALLGTWSGVWPLVVLPAFSASLAELIAARLTLRDPVWERRALLCLLAMPGMLWMTLTFGAAIRFQRFPVHTWRCIVTIYGGLAVAALIGLRATARQVRRSRAIARLRSVAGPPARRLAEAAARSDIRVEQIETDRPFCALVGVWRPRVVVSRGAIDRLSDDELCAALQHERAHQSLHEVFWASLVALSADCSLFRARRAHAAYRRCREFVADDAAARTVAAVDLASALLALARSPAAPMGVGFAETADVPVRIARLLRPEHEPQGRSYARAAIAALAALGAAILPVLLLVAARLCHGG
jgi:Zn-dependent protease with chaperone function